MHNIHISSNTNVNQDTRKILIKQKLYNIKQKNNQSLEEYYNEFKYLIDACKNINAEIPTDQEIAVLFLNGLLRLKFDELLNDINNYPEIYLYNYNNNNESLNIDNAYIFSVNNSSNRTETDDSDLILLDSCAQISVFNSLDLLNDIKKINQPILLSRINKSTDIISTNYIGKLNSLSKLNIAISNNVRRNILCLVDIINYHGIMKTIILLFMEIIINYLLSQCKIISYVEN